MENEYENLSLCEMGCMKFLWIRHSPSHDTCKGENKKYAQTQHHLYLARVKMFY